MMLGQKAGAAIASNALPNRITSMITPIGTEPTKLLTMTDAYICLLTGDDRSSRLRVNIPEHVSSRTKLLH
jgi:hypothetical protein